MIAVKRGAMRQILTAVTIRGPAAGVAPGCDSVAACPACWSCGMWTTP